MIFYFILPELLKKSSILRKWDIGISQGNRLIQAAKVMSNLTPMGVIAEELIDNPRKTRILSKFEPEIQKLIIQDLQDNNITEILSSQK